MKKAHLRRCLDRASLRRTTAYVSVVPTFAALHLDLFDQPEPGSGEPQRRSQPPSTRRLTPFIDAFSRRNTTAPTTSRIVTSRPVGGRDPRAPPWAWRSNTARR